MNILSIRIIIRIKMNLKVVWPRWQPVQPELLIELTSWRGELNKAGSSHQHLYYQRHLHHYHLDQYNHHDCQTRERQIENLRSIQRLGDNLASLRLVMNIVARIIQMIVLTLDGADDDHGEL